MYKLKQYIFNTKQNIQKIVTDFVLVFSKILERHSNTGVFQNFAMLLLKYHTQINSLL